MTWTPLEYFGPDIYPDHIYAAVGRAVCAWEETEHRFSNLYTIFRGRPTAAGGWTPDGDTVVEYGARQNGDSGGFEGRMSRLSKTAESYFTRFSCQEMEGELGALIAEALPLSRKRNHLAHCVLVREWRLSDKTWPNTIHSPDHYSVQPPWYAAKSLTKRDGPSLPPEEPLLWIGFSYRTADIDGFTEHFRALGSKIDALAERIWPPSNRD